MFLYDVQDLVPTNFEIKEKKAQPTQGGNQSYTSAAVVLSGNSISRTNEIVKENFSFSEDSDLDSGENSQIFLRNMSQKRYETLLTKKPIRLIKKEAAKVYANINARYLGRENVPDIDIFYVGEYNEVNRRYEYIVRND